MLDNALEALKTFNWGTSLTVVAPIEDAVVAAHDKPDAKRQLENQLIAALKGSLSRDAQDYVCRKLAIIGSAASVPTLAVRLIDKDSSHMARFALEQIPGSEASAALQDALPKVSGRVKIGVINSLGARRDATAAKALGSLLQDSDIATARAAALALGAIGSAEAAEILQGAIRAIGGKSDAGPIFDGLLNCAEALLADQKVSEATAIYHGLNDPKQPRLIRLAATRGLLACAGRQA